MDSNNSVADSQGFPLREADLPQDPSKDFVERPELAPPPPLINEEASTVMAHIAGKALGLGPEVLPALRDEYARTGRIQEYKRLNSMAMNVNDVQQAELASAAIAKSVRENNIDVSRLTQQQVDETLMPVVNKYKTDKDMLDKNPVAADAVRQLQSAATSPLADAFDAEEGLGSEVLTADHVRYALSLGKDQHDATTAIFGEEVGEYGFWKNLVQSVAFGVTLPFNSKALAEELGLEGSALEHMRYGTTMQQIRELILKSPPSQQKLIYEKIGKVFRENKSFFTDYNYFSAVDELMSPEFLAGIGTSGSLGDVTSDIFPAIDAATFPGGKMLTSAFFKLSSTPLLKLASKVNPATAGEELMAGLKASASDVRKLYNVEKPVLGQTQVPNMPESVVHDLPDIAGALEEKERLQALQIQLNDKARELDAAAIPLSSKLSQVERDAAQILSVNNGLVLPGKSTIAPFADGTGYRMSFMLGRRSDKGFPTLLSARNAARKAIDKGAAKQASVWSSDGADVTPLMTLDELAGMSDNALKKARGNYYIRLTDDHLFTEVDHALSPTGSAMDISKGWLGRARNYAANPSAWMDRDIYKQYLLRFSAQSRMTAQLDAIVNPWLKLPIKSKWKINDAMVWSADFGKRELRNPTMREIQEQFGGTLNEKELKGLYSARAYFDTLYQLENRRVFRSLMSKGAKTIRTKDGKTAYHGVPYQTPAAAKDVTRVFDPALNTIVDIDEEALRALYKAGGRVLKTEIAPALRGTDEVVHHVVFDPKTAKGWEYGLLSNRPLKYIHGYFPRMYEDPYIIMKTMPKVMVDGKLQPHTVAVHTAGSRKEAAEAIARLTELNADKKYTYSMKRDVRLSQLDETAANQELMRMEGRLFYDERNVDRLTHVSGSEADIIAPINTIARSARMVAKQVTMEDYNTHMVNLWTASWGNAIKQAAKKAGYKGNTSINPDLLSVEESLRALQNIANEPGELGKIGKDALETFRYVQMMRGAMDPSSNILRSKLISLGEMLYNNGVFGDTVRKFGSRDLWKFSPLQMARELTFFHFIAANPIKQFVLNAQQHMFLLALDPTYIGRWQLDTAMLLSGARARNKALAGVKGLSERAMKLQARAMRLTDEEYKLLVDKFTGSGLLDNVNIRAALGDIPTEAANVPMTQTGRVASKLWGTVSARPIRRAMERQGFDAGEQINLTSSYLPALRAVLKENKLKSLTQLTDTQWNDVAAKALDYSSAMIRPNASRYQHGLLAVPLQFLQFQHKTFLTILGMNKAFTRKQSLQILGGQLIMFGGGTFGITPEVKKMLAEAGVDDPFWVDVLSGGFIDWLLDKSFQAIFDDPKMNSNWSTYLSPASGIRQLTEDFIDIGFKNAPIDSFFGVSGFGASKMIEAAKMSYNLLNAPEEVSWDERKVWNVLDAVAAGSLAGYSQFQHAMVAKKLGFWQAANGEVSSVEARTGELFLRGFLGVNPESFEINSGLMRGLNDSNNMDKDTAKALKSDVRKYYDDLRTMVNRYGEGVYSKDYFLTMIAAQKALVIETRDPVQKHAFYEEFNSLATSAREQQDSLQVAITKAIGAGGHVQEWMIAEVQNSNLADDQKASVIALIKTQLEQAEASVPSMMQNIDTDLQAFKPVIN